MTSLVHKKSPKYAHSVFILKSPVFVMISCCSNILHQFFFLTSESTHWKKVPQQNKADIDNHVYVNSSGDKNADCEKILSLNTDIEPITSLIKVQCWNNRAITPTGPNWMLVKLSVCDIP